MRDRLPPNVFREQSGAVEAGQHPWAEIVFGRCVEVQERMNIAGLPLASRSPREGLNTIPVNLFFGVAIGIFTQSAGPPLRRCRPWQGR